VYVSEPLSAFPPSPLPAYDWVWPDATARLAQAVTPAQVGGWGYQEDLGVAFKLIRVGPPVFWWGAYWEGFGAIRGSYFNNNNTSAQNAGHNGSTTEGALALALGNVYLLERVGVANSALAGAATAYKSGVGNPPRCTAVTYRFVWSIDQVSANHKWAVGAALSGPVGNQDFTLLVNCFLFGRGLNEANVQLYRNDAVGLSIPIDLGASFPANTAGIVYEAIFRVALNATAGPIAYQLTRSDTLAAVSGVLTTEIPGHGTQPLLQGYSCNGGDLAIDSIGLGSVQYAQAMGTSAA
jgi:hypothetical protein